MCIHKWWMLYASHNAPVDIPLHSYLYMYHQLLVWLFLVHIALIRASWVLFVVVYLLGYGGMVRYYVIIATCLWQIISSMFLQPKMSSGPFFCIPNSSVWISWCFSNSGKIFWVHYYWHSSLRWSSYVRLIG